MLKHHSNLEFGALLASYKAQHSINYQKFTIHNSQLNQMSTRTFETRGPVDPTRNYRRSDK